MTTFNRGDYARVHQIGYDLWLRAGKRQELRSWALELMDLTEAVLGQMHRPKGAGPLPATITKLIGGDQS